MLNYVAASQAKTFQASTSVHNFFPGYWLGLQNTQINVYNESRR